VDILDYEYEEIIIRSISIVFHSYMYPAPAPSYLSASPEDYLAHSPIFGTLCCRGRTQWQRAVLPRPLPATGHQRGYSTQTQCPDCCCPLSALHPYRVDQRIWRLRAGKCSGGYTAEGRRVRSERRNMDGQRRGRGCSCCSSSDRMRRG